MDFVPLAAAFLVVFSVGGLVRTRTAYNQGLMAWLLCVLLCSGGDGYSLNTTAVLVLTYLLIWVVGSWSAELFRAIQ